MGYTGSEDLIKFANNVEFVQITSAGLKESHVHDVDITRESQIILRMYNQLMRHALCIIALFISSNIASSNSYYQDAVSNFQNNNFEKSIQFLEKDIVFNPKSPDLIHSSG